ncbi:hypothetical protein [Fischerella thermalis]|nr:hypothetical protein [Fischerella thermalis]
MAGIDTIETAIAVTSADADVLELPYLATLVLITIFLSLLGNSSLRW